LKTTAVIMAGGYGERFWPLSRMNKPKQILNLSSDSLNMLQESLARIKGLIDFNDVYVITGSALAEPIRKSLPEIPPENVIAEPAKRNTAPCLALAAAYISSRYEEHDDEIVMAVLTADHKIEPTGKFQNIVTEVLDYTGKHQVLATIGIKPERPETGFGYIETSDFISGRIRGVKGFREKPTSRNAQRYLDDGNFLWNSGMFFWNTAAFKNEMIINAPEIGNKISEMEAALRSNSINDICPDKVCKIFEEFPSISIDYALMEKSSKVVCIESDFKWDDIGAWDSLARVRNKDASGNILSGDVLLLDSKDSIVINSQQNGMKITGVGLENLIVINAGDSILICPKDRAQDVKLIVNELRVNGNTELL